MPSRLSGHRAGSLWSFALPSPPASRRRSTFGSNVEDLDVMLLDLVAHLLDRGGIVLHHLDIFKRRTAGLFLGVRVHRTQAADIDDELLALGREAVAAEQL